MTTETMQPFNHFCTKKTLKLFVYFVVSADRLKLLLGFAVGALLGDVFLHLLPEAIALSSPGM